MTPPSKQPLPPRPLGRRAFLVATGVTTAAFVSGCGAVDDLLNDSPEPSATTPSGTTDDDLIGSALADQQRVLAYCLAVRRAHKPVRNLLTPMADHHRAHVEILGGDTADAQRRTHVPSDSGRALQRLAELERKASRQRATDATRAESGEFARVLAGVSASQAQHVYLIEQTLGEAKS